MDLKDVSVNIKLLKQPKKIHQHKLRHLETKKNRDYSGYSSKYTRIDIFHCESCGEILINKKSEYSVDEPEWY